MPEHKQLVYNRDLDGELQAWVEAKRAYGWILIGTGTLDPITGGTIYTFEATTGADT